MGSTNVMDVVDTLPNQSTLYHINTCHFEEVINFSSLCS